ncbi:MAG: MepB family protein [Chlamydiae bacterium]|nr:MepB family protein [Chlamydiota bacterium]
MHKSTHNPVKTGNSDLLLLEEFLFKHIGIVIENLKVEKESVEYAAAEFTVKGHLVKYREAKITPTKIGQFVTFWKLIGKGPIMPYQSLDLFDFLVVSVRAGNHVGQFEIKKKVLCEKGIVSTDKKEGKRAMRVYPPWDKTDNPQARKTQCWQLEWFIDFSENVEVNLARLGDFFK